jgi:hypothetical protein
MKEREKKRNNGQQESYCRQEGKKLIKRKGTKKEMH